jgi:hypothetical protein
MSKAASNFRRTDVKRAAQALKSAGLKIARVELQEGKVVFFPHGEAMPTDPEKINEWDGAE